MSSKRWGKSLIAIAALVAASPKAFSQTAPGSGLVGGGAQATSGAGQQQAGAGPVLPRAFILASDPFAGGDFARCEQQAAMQEAAAAAQEKVNNFDIKKVGVESVAGMLGGTLASGSLGSASLSGAASGLTGDACAKASVDGTEKAAECTLYIANGKFDEPRMMLDINELLKNKSIAACKVRSANRAMEMTSCFSNELTNLKAAMKEVKKDFIDATNKMQQYETQVSGMIESEEKKQNQLNDRATAFARQADNIQNLLAEINGAAQTSGEGQGDPSTITGLQQNIDTHKARLTQFEGQKVTQVSQATFGCMMGSGATTSRIRTCPNANADLLNPKDCGLSLYHDQILSELANGGKRFSNADKKKAEVKTKIFSQRLEQMLSDFAGGNVRSFEQFKTKYGAELGSYGPAGRLLLQETGNCASEAQANLSRDLADPTSKLGQFEAANRNEANGISSQLGSMLNKLDVAMRDAGSQVFNQELNQFFDGFGCHRTSVTTNAPRDASGAVTGAGQVSIQPVALSKQLDCVKGLEATLRSMLNGTVPPGSNAPLQAPLNVTDGQGKPVRCQGLRDCAKIAQRLAGESSELVASMKGTATFTNQSCPQGCPGLTKFHKESNEQIRTAAQTVADLFTRRIATMKGQFERLKELLGKSDVDFGDDPASNIDLEAFCPSDDSQVCKLPPDFEEQLIALAGAPALDGSDFKDAKAAAKSQVADNQAIADRLGKNADLLQRKIESCKKEVQEEAVATTLAKQQKKIDGMLRRCRTATLNGEDPTSGNDWGSNLEKLQTDLEKVCDKSPKNELCADLGGRINEDLTAECSAAFNERQSQKMQNMALMEAIRSRSGGGGLNVGGQ